MLIQEFLLEILSKISVSLKLPGFADVILESNSLRTSKTMIFKFHNILSML